jgi:serine O-acetyltransferase
MQDSSQVDPWKLIGEDFRRYKAYGSSNAMAVVLIAPGFRALVRYRIFLGLYQRCRIKPLKRLIWAWYAFVRRRMEGQTGISLPLHVTLGRAPYFPHNGSFQVARGTEVGDYCVFHQGVTLGTAGHLPQHLPPKIGNRVFVGANASVIGEISIGDDSVVGANAVVIRDVPAMAVVVGNPARQIADTGSSAYMLLAKPD